MVPTRLVASALLLGLLVLANSAQADDESPGVGFLDDPASLEAVLERAKTEGKDVVIDFTAEWCGWCHKLDDDVFSKAEAAKALQGYVCARFDVDKDVGSRIAGRFHVNGYPTVLFLDADGREIDRIGGYSPLTKYLEKVARIARDENTLRSLRQYVADHPDDIEVAAVYVTKLVEADPAQAAEMLPALLAKSEDAAPLARAKLLLLLADSHREAGRADDAFAAWERVVREAGGTEEAYRAASNAGWVGRQSDPARALAVVELATASESDDKRLAALAGIKAMLLRETLAKTLEEWARRAWDDGQTLNEVAWEAYLRRLRTPQAVAWAERAVKLTDRDPAVLDTLANLLFESGRMDEAIRIEVEAMRTASDPDMRLQFQEALLRMKAIRLHRVHGQADAK